jgi:hypothetical protein
VPTAAFVEANDTVTGFVPEPLAGDTEMRALLDVTVQFSAPPPAVCVTMNDCAGVFTLIVVPLRTAPKLKRPRSSVRPPPDGGGAVVGIVTGPAGVDAGLIPFAFCAKT